MADDYRDRQRRARTASIENAGQVQRRPAKCRYSKALIDETIEIWQPHYENKLTDEDACEIIANMSTFFALLMGIRGEIGICSETSPDPD